MIGKKVLVKVSDAGLKTNIHMNFRAKMWSGPNITGRFKSQPVSAESQYCLSELSPAKQMKAKSLSAEHDVTKPRPKRNI